MTETQPITGDLADEIEENKMTILATMTVGSE